MELLVVAVKDNLTVVQKRHSVGQAFGTGHIVTDNGRGDLVLLAGQQDNLIDLLDHDRIQPRGRFVKQHQLRVGDERAGQADPFAHTAR